MAKDTSNHCCEQFKTVIGGQALIEGIMMRGPEKTAMAVRTPQGEIVIECSETKTLTRAKFFKLPIIRGVFSYLDSMVLGTKCLMRSAEISGLEEAEAELRREKEEKKARKAAKKKAKNGEATEIVAAPESENNSADETVTKVEQKTEEKKQSSAVINIVMAFSVILGIGFSILLFMILPSFLYEGAIYLMPFLKNGNSAIDSLIKSVFEGLLKIVILVGYMAGVSLMKDIKRTFMYHGAEHKAIFCYEAGLELTVENVRKQKRFHPRCGTSFLILMLLVSIFVSFFIDPLFILIFGFTPVLVIRILIKLLMLPLIVGVGYELIKLAGRYDNAFTRIISAPGVWLQHITTKEPEDGMIECAIAALNEVIPDNGEDNW